MKSTKRLSIDRVCQICDARQIEFVGPYTSALKKTPVKCRKCGYEWPGQISVIQDGHGCPKCGGSLPKTLADYQSLAARHGIQIKRAGTNTKDKAVWVCPKHGEFLRSYSSISKDRGACPFCDDSLGERQCREAMQQLFGAPFDSTVLRGVRGVGGGYIELDAYNEERKLAIEHHGYQHYRPVPMWGGSAQLSKQQEHDRRRREFCEMRGITLIEIPQLGEITPLSELKAIIKNKCVKAGVPLPLNFDDVILDLLPVSLKTNDERFWHRTKEAARVRGWKVESRHYLGSRVPHEFTCLRGHLVRKTPDELLNGKTGCKKCWILERRERLRAAIGRPVLLSDGAMYATQTEAAFALSVSMTNTQRALKKSGKCRGRYITKISRAQYSLFLKNSVALCDFVERTWPASMETRRMTRACRPVLFSDKTLFPSTLAAARSKSCYAFAVLSAIERKGTCGGCYVARISQEEYNLIRNRADLVEHTCRKLWPSIA